MRQICSVYCVELLGKEGPPARNNRGKGDLHASAGNAACSILFYSSSHTFADHLCVNIDATLIDEPGGVFHLV